MLTQGPSVLRSSRIGDNGALQLQADNFQNAINERENEINKENLVPNSVEEFELRERKAGLEGG